MFYCLNIVMCSLHCAQLQVSKGPWSKMGPTPIFGVKKLVSMVFQSFWYNFELGIILGHFGSITIFWAGQEVSEVGHNSLVILKSPFFGLSLWYLTQSYLMNTHFPSSSLGFPTLYEWYTRQLNEHLFFVTLGSETNFLRGRINLFTYF